MVSIRRHGREVVARRSVVGCRCRACRGRCFRLSSEEEVEGKNVGGVPLHAVVAFILAVLDGAEDGQAVALLDEPLGDVGEAAPADDAVPLRLFGDFCAVLFLVSSGRGGEGEGGDLQPALEGADFGVFADVAEEEDLVEGICSCDYK